MQEGAREYSHCPKSGVGGSEEAPQVIHLLEPGDRLGRREMLCIGGLSMTGLALSDLLAAAQTPARSSTPRSFGSAKNCIILFLSGGASHHDTFDPKPSAPAEVRGEFGVIDTSVAGIQFCEHLFWSAHLADRLALVRSVTHRHPDHAVGGYVMFTGRDYPRSPGEAELQSRDDAPHIGSSVARVAPGSGPFPFAMIPRRVDAGSGRRAGQWAGVLGSRYDPLVTEGDPNDNAFRLEHLPLVPHESLAVFERRRHLVDQLNRQWEALDQTPLARALTENRRKALDVLGSDAVRRAVDLASEESWVRDRYGRNLFGQSVLLGRRLLDAGTRLVQVNWLRSQGRKGYAWDSHREHFDAMRHDLLPPLDRALGALVTDLEHTGQLAETLVVVAGEFGRTPRVNRHAGRDHWSNVFTVVLAGGGVRGGQVYGASDKIGAEPIDRPVSPADLTATIFHCLGIDPHTKIYDQLDRPVVLSTGRPLYDLFA